jgi:hypothetical protein
MQATRLYTPCNAAKKTDVCRHPFPSIAMMMFSVQSGTCEGFWSAKRSHLAQSKALGTEVDFILAEYCSGKPTKRLPRHHKTREKEETGEGKQEEREEKSPEGGGGAGEKRSTAAFSECSETVTRHVYCCNDDKVG